MRIQGSMSRCSPQLRSELLVEACITAYIFKSKVYVMYVLGLLGRQREDYQISWSSLGYMRLCLIYKTANAHLHR